MTNGEENCLTMLQATWSILDTNAEKLELPALKAAVLDFEAVLAKVKDLVQQTMTATAGKADTKAGYREALEEALIVISRAIQAYGHRVGDPEIVEKVHVVKSELEYMRDTVLVAKATAIHKIAADHLAELAGYGVTAEKLESLKKKIRVFESALGDREGSVARQKGARTGFRAYMDEAKDLLENEIDNLMAGFKESNPQLYYEYTEARRTKDVGLRHRDSRDEDTPPPEPDGPDSDGPKPDDPEPDSPEPGGPESKDERKWNSMNT